MERVGVLAAACLLAACGGKDANCDFSTIKGTYTVHFDEQPGGQCGAITDINVFVDADSETADPGCIIANQSKDEKACTADIDETCDDTADGIRVHEIAHLDVQSNNEKFTGSATFQLENLSTGSTICVSTYKLTYTLQ